jgi:octaprenyl-diphosphate synthase
MMVETGSMRVMEILSEATNIIAEGEVLQLMNMHDASLSEADYLKSFVPKPQSSLKPAPTGSRTGKLTTSHRGSMRHLWASTGHSIPDH